MVLDYQINEKNAAVFTNRAHLSLRNRNESWKLNIYVLGFVRLKENK